MLMRMCQPASRQKNGPNFKCLDKTLLLYAVQLPVFKKESRAHPTSVYIKGSLVATHRCQKTAADKKFQIHYIQDNLAPVLIDWNKFKQRSKWAKKVTQTATETIGNDDKIKEA